MAIDNFIHGTLNGAHDLFPIMFCVFISGCVFNDQPCMHEYNQLSSEQMMREADQDGDGAISFAEFERVMTLDSAGTEFHK